MSLFSQIISEMSLSSLSLEQLVMKQGNNRNAKGFTSKTHLVAMIFSHLARADSLREISNGIFCCNGKVKSLGIKAAPKRSTLAYSVVCLIYKTISADMAAVVLQRQGIQNKKPPDTCSLFCTYQKVYTIYGMVGGAEKTTTASENLSTCLRCHRRCCRLCLHPGGPSPFS